MDLEDATALRAPLHGREPRPVRTHWVDVDGVRWPLRQVVTLATGVDRSRISTRAAHRALRRLGFETSEAPPPPPGEVPDVTALLDPRNAGAAADFLAAGRAASNEPGLYSWWADAVGAADLTRGLGHEVVPSLVYAGRAGGIRPSGVRSTNTLWGRLATMHLGGRRQFSTFRLTLSACLSPEGGPAVGEQELTDWMHRHLRVAVLPLPIESVAPGEERLLELADPPLNLRDVPRTDLRRALARRRKALPT
ncbi:GIY-YIG nuclease family protein [Geodermatophilus amargosae]|uniref:GIY-YIG nuclease family protein n=1 Tax=Geodermatophilus amargosae TaxID=1296565 RepID=UPI0034DE1439